MVKKKETRIFASGCSVFLHTFTGLQQSTILGMEMKATKKGQVGIKWEEEKEEGDEKERTKTKQKETYSEFFTQDQK